MKRTIIMRKRIPSLDMKRIRKLTEDGIKEAAKEFGVSVEEYTKDLNESYEQFFGEKSPYA